MFTPRALCAGLVMLATLQALMLLSLMAGLAPHPPRELPMFAMGPFLSAAIALALGAALLVRVPSHGPKLLAILAALVALVSYGPHKWFDAVTPSIWPAVLVGQLTAVWVIAAAIAQMREARAPQRGA
jgi:hypothetical protein